MKKILLSSRENFHVWQAKAIQGVDDKGQMAVSTMAMPAEYPVLLVWSFHEEVDMDTSCMRALSDVLEYKYIYITDFPVKATKKGTYLYQIYQTFNDFGEV
jgi:hypothetical protein